MARKVRNTPLETRNARAKLKVRGKPYYCAVGPGLHVGYRKGKTGGKWLMRRYDGEGDYDFEKLGLADDVADADGIDVLDFWQAQEKALKLGRRHARVERGEHPDREGPYTVSDAIEDYLDDYQRRSGRSYDRLSQTINTHIKPKFSNQEVAAFTRKKVRDWHVELSRTPARLRTGAGKEQNYRPLGDDPETQRRRRNTANRVLSILKAILNHAYQEGLVEGDDAWSSVKPFKDVESATIRYLSDEESRRLVNTCPDDLRKMVTAALLTGARYSELANLIADDFDAQAKTIHIRMSKSGKPRHIALTDEGVTFFEQNVAGKLGKDLMFRRASGSKWGHAHQSRLIREACGAAKINPAIGFHILRHTYASRLAMKGVPLPVIAAQLGHADTRITEKHYAHLAPNYVADTVRAAFGDLGLLQDTNLIAITGQD